MLQDRLQRRNTESEEALNQRINKAAEEMKEEVHFDMAVLNENLDVAINEAEHLVKSFIRGK